MPRLEVENTTTDAEIHEAMLHAIAAAHVLEAKMGNRAFSRATKADHAAAIEMIHDELERLNTILIRRGARVPV